MELRVLTTRAGGLLIQTSLSSFLPFLFSSWRSKCSSWNEIELLGEQLLPGFDRAFG